MNRFSLWQDSLQLLVNPAYFFSTLSADHSIGKSLVKVIYYGLISSLLLVFLFVNGKSINDGSAMISLLMALGLGLIVILNNILVLFVGGLIVSMISAIGKNKSDFRLGVQVVAAIEVLLIPLVFIVMTAIDETLKYYINVVLNMYALYLLYNALIYTFKSRRMFAVVITVFLGLISLIPIQNHPNIF
jgi:hypothetical protein